MMLDFAEQTGSGIVIMVWSFLNLQLLRKYKNSANDITGVLLNSYVPGTGTLYIVPGTRYPVRGSPMWYGTLPCTEFGNQMHNGTS